MADKPLQPPEEDPGYMFAEEESNEEQADRESDTCSDSEESM